MEVRFSETRKKELIRGLSLNKNMKTGLVSPKGLV
jgi:hypothetical protein